MDFVIIIIFHYIFPPLTIGLSVILVYLQFKYIRTKDLKFDIATNFWIKIFSLNFAIGALFGIVMESQHGANFAMYNNGECMRRVFGPFLTVGGLFTFFLEGVFLVILLSAKKRITKIFYFFLICMMSLGGIFSSIWIIIVNNCTYVVP